jgi:RNA polymerase sigma-70 factor (ECF subfamily)
MELQDSVTPLTNPPASLLGLWDGLKRTADDGEGSFDSEHTLIPPGNIGKLAGSVLASSESAQKQAPSGHESSAVLSGNDYARATDDQLLAAAKASDDRAFEELSGRHLRAMRKRVYSIVRNPEDAEDVVQDSLLKAYRHLQDFRESCEFSTWIAKIAINTALMLLRKRRSRPEVSLYPANETEQTWTIDDFPDPSPSTERACARREMLELVSRAVNHLPPLYRSVVEHYHVQGQSLREAADKLGITVESAKSRLFRARRTLRSKLERQRISIVDACY